MGNYSQVGYTTCFQRCVNVANSTKVQHWQTLLKSTYFQRWFNVINQPYLNGENLVQRCSTSWPTFNLKTTLKQRCVPAGLALKEGGAYAFLSQGEFKPSSSDSADRRRSIIRVTLDYELCKAVWCQSYGLIHKRYTRNLIWTNQR